MNSSFYQFHNLKNSRLVIIFRLDKLKPFQIFLILIFTFFKKSSNIEKSINFELHLNTARIKATLFTMLIKKSG